MSDVVWCEWDHDAAEQVPATIELLDNLEGVWSAACDECADGNVAQRRELRDEGDLE